METEKTIWKRKEPYNLRSGAFSSIASPEERRRCYGRVSKVQKKETAQGKKPGDDEVSEALEKETSIGKKTGYDKVSKAQEERAEGKKPGDDEVEIIRDPRSGRGPPPVSAEQLQKDLIDIQRRTRDYASKAMYWYNKGRRQLGLPIYMVVEILGLEGIDLRCGHVWHLNFKARPKDDPAAPPELFFAERIISWEGLKETRCYNMGSEPPQPDTVGRKACHLCYETYHPRGKEFVGSRDHNLL